MMLQPPTTTAGTANATTSKIPVFHHRQQNHLSLSSNLSNSISFLSGFGNSSLVKPITGATHKNPVVTYSSISQVHSYGTMDYEKRPVLKWKALYRRICALDNQESGVSSELDRCENDGKYISRWELFRVVKELRKFKHYNLALQIYGWMNSKGERFRMTTSGTAIQLDLISKVHGISEAEEYFLKLPDNLKDHRVHGAMLNAYARFKLREKAETIFDKMRNSGYANNVLPFNVMMTLYMNIGEYEQVESLVSELVKNKIPLDIFSYNILLSCCGSQESVEKMEQVYELMKQDGTIVPNWTSFSTMATVYIKLGSLEKAEECLKKVESRITGRDRMPYHYLLTHYGSIGKKDEVHRIWNAYKSAIPYIPNTGYIAVIASLVKLNDIEGAEKIYNEWLPVKSSYDPRVVNFLLGWYVNNGLWEKAVGIFDAMVKAGGKPNTKTWEILAQGHVDAGRLSEAVSCLKDAAALSVQLRSWKPKPVILASALKLCEREQDEANKEALLAMLKQVGCLDDQYYMSNISLSENLGIGEQTMANDPTEDGEEGAEVLLEHLQESL